MNKYDFHGFPVVEQRKLLGYITRAKLMTVISRRLPNQHCTALKLPQGHHLSDDLDADQRARRCTFFSQTSGANGSMVDLSGNFEAVLQLRKEVPLEVVVTMFQRLVSIKSANC